MNGGLHRRTGVLKNSPGASARSLLMRATMIKKLFGLASVTVLAGFVVAVSAAGCSSTHIYSYADEGGTVPGKVGLKPGDPGYVAPNNPKDPPPKVDASKPPPVDEPDSSTPGATCPSTTPITAAEIDAQLLWKAPAAFSNVCTQQNIDALKLLFKNAPAGGGVTYAAIKTSLGPTCAACAFSPIAGATWQVFVEDAAGAVDNRTGSCFAQRSGAACGKARFRWETCLDAACPQSDCGAGVQACTAKAQKGACKGLTTDYASACPNEVTDLPICGNVFGAIATSCSGGPGNTIDTTP